MEILEIHSAPPTQLWAISRKKYMSREKKDGKRKKEYKGKERKKIREKKERKERKSAKQKKNPHRANILLLYSHLHVLTANISWMAK